MPNKINNLKRKLAAAQKAAKVKAAKKAAKKVATAKKAKAKAAKKVSAEKLKKMYKKAKKYQVRSKPNARPAAREYAIHTRKK